MPYKSLKQERYMNWAAEHGKIKQATVNEFNQASKGLHLPERVQKPKFKKLAKRLKQR